MEALTASGLLEVYERGREGSDAERALLLLAAASPGTSPGSFAEMSIGRRDALLFDLRHRTFGSWLEGVVACPGCGESLELSLDMHDLRVPLQSEDGSWRHLSIDGFEVDVRLPTGADLVAVGTQPDPAAGRQWLLDRCIRWTHAGRRRSPARLPESVIAQIGEELGAADPQAMTDVSIQCPSCGQRHVVLFDIASFLWAEIRALVPRLLEQVHALASTYGWSEASVLGMSGWRRRAYLDLVGR